MLVMISKQLKGANFDASAYFNESIKSKCPIIAKIPIEAIKYHWLDVGWIQTNGIAKEIITTPVKPVNKSVNRGLSEVLSLGVISK